MNIDVIYLAGGCFWGLEAYFRRIPGVVDVISGYANGNTDAPSYEDVCHSSGHVETVKVTYDTDSISLSHILQYFLRVVDPFSVNRQGNDVGIQYRSGVYYTSPEQEAVIRKTLQKAESHYKQPFAIEILPLQSFYEAEDYHQQYLDKNPGGYCHINLQKADEPLIDLDEYTPKDDDTLRKELSPLQYSVTQESATERPFTHEYTSRYDKGIYVDITSGEPLFVSSDKFESGCGWPSFAKPINSDVIIYYRDQSHNMERLEVRSRIGNAHLGHVFEDGPKELGGLRYCINGASLRFIPLTDMEKEGYANLIPYVK